MRQTFARMLQLHEQQGLREYIICTKNLGRAIQHI